MPDLLDQLQSAMNASRKAQSKDRTLVLGTLLSSLKNREIELKRPLADEDAIDVLRRGVKTRRESVEQYEKASLAIKDPALKAWIDNTLPTLRYHLATAERSTPIEVKQASAPAPAKAAAPRPGRPAAVHAVAVKRSVPRPELATQSMGAGPAKQGMQQTGGTMQLGATKSVAARPTESNSR